MNYVNARLGYSTPDGKIRGGKQGVWYDAKANKAMIGPGKSLNDFLGLSPKKQTDYLNSKAFDADVRTRVDDAVNDMSPDYKKSLEAGATSAKKVEGEVMDVNDRTKVKNPAKFESYRKAVGVAIGVGATGFTLAMLHELATARSGCFLVGPDGQERKVAGDNCSCEGGVGNPNAIACCNACGDMLCPGKEWGGEGSEPPVWACPGEASPPAGLARAMRAEISGAAALNRTRATSAPTARSGFTGSGETCRACGCSDREWKLCHRDFSIFDVMTGALASAGKMFNALGDIVNDGVKAVTGAVKTVIIAIGAVIAVVVLVAILVAVIKAVVKKRKKSGR